MAHTDFADCLPTSAANSLSDQSQIVTARHIWEVVNLRGASIGYLPLKPSIDDRDPCRLWAILLNQVVEPGGIGRMKPHTAM